MNINSVNPLNLGTACVNGYIEEKDSNKYIVFDLKMKIKNYLKMFLMELKIK